MDIHECLCVLQLSPPDSDIQTSHKRAITEAQQFSSKLSIVVLSADKNDADSLDDAKQDQACWVGANIMQSVFYFPIYGKFCTV